MKFLVLLLLCGCATVSEERLYERENRRVLAEEEFYHRKEMCEQAGGRMVVTLETSRLGSKRYSASEYRRAQCMGGF